MISRQNSQPANGAANIINSAFQPLFSALASPINIGEGPRTGTPAPSLGSQQQFTFGAPAPSFGSQQPFTFGAQQTATPFGAQQFATPFGAQSAPAQPTPTFGGLSAPPKFKPSIFSAGPQGAFSFSNASAPAFSFGGASTGTSLQHPQPVGLSQQQAQQQYGGLTTLDGKPVQKTTKWEEMSPSCQNFFNQMQYAQLQTDVLWGFAV